MGKDVKNLVGLRNYQLTGNLGINAANNNCCFRKKFLRVDIQVSDLVLEKVVAENREPKDY